MIKNKAEIKTREFDAGGKVLGRLATEIVGVLRGKDNPLFYPNLLLGEKVIVRNASRMVITGNKLTQKKYYHHTGYLGHLKTTTLKDLMIKNPAEVLERAVYGMLPKNKLRPIWMKNLKVYANSEEDNA